MKAMILAAGMGTRMQPLTNTQPKPLLKAGGKMLIEYHLEALSNAGFKEVVINTHWCAEQIPQSLGTGERWGLTLSYSHEIERLETAGGIRQAISQLCSHDNELFLVINGDIYCEFNLPNWLASEATFHASQTACLAMVANPEQHPNGDFYLKGTSGLLSLTENTGYRSYTYAGLALFKASFFKEIDATPRPLAPLLRHAITREQIRGTVMQGTWMDIGTPARLKQLDHYLMQQASSNH